jgi:hypothetical protein
MLINMIFMTVLSYVWYVVVSPWLCLQLSDCGSMFSLFFNLSVKFIVFLYLFTYNIPFWG